MSLEDEIAIYRFGQGVGPIDALLAQFAQLEEIGKRMWLRELYFLIWNVKPIDADVDQAIAGSGLDPDDSACLAFKTHRWHAGTVDLPESDIDHVYTLLLYLVKLAYQRQRALMNDNPTDWRYADLSSATVIDSVLTRHKALVDAIYANASFRSEFVTIAKLWYERNESRKPKRRGAEPVVQTTFEFINYHDLISQAINLFNDKYTYGLQLLQRSVSRGIAKQYGLADNEIERVTLTVLERHLRELYNTGLF